MSPDMKRLCEAVMTAAYSADCDGFQCSRSDEPKAAEAIARAVLMELREVSGEAISHASVDLLREVTDPWDVMSPDEEEFFGLDENAPDAWAPAEERIRPKMRRSFTAMINHILTDEP